MKNRNKHFPPIWNQFCMHVVYNTKKA